MRARVQAADPVAKLDVSEMVAAEKDPELAAKHVVNTLVRFHSEVKRTYRYYAAMHCPPSEAFTLALEQLDTLLHDIKVPTLDLPLADAHRVFFGSLLRPGAGQPKLTASPEPSVNQLVSEAMSARQSAIDMHAPARPILLREFTSGLVRLAHARHAQLPSLAQRVHELMTAHLLPNARATPSHGASTIERERAQSVGGDELELHWPAVRAVRDAFLDQLHPIWLACAAPRAEDTPAHRRPRAPDNRASDETCRCREFAQLLRNTRLLPAGMTVADALVVRAPAPCAPPTPSAARAIACARVLPVGALRWPQWFPRAHTCLPRDCPSCGALLCATTPRLTAATRAQSHPDALRAGDGTQAL